MATYGERVDKFWLLVGAEEKLNEQTNAGTPVVTKAPKHPVQAQMGWEENSFDMHN